MKISSVSMGFQRSIPPKWHGFYANLYAVLYSSFDSWNTCWRTGLSNSWQGRVFPTSGFYLLLLSGEKSSKTITIRQWYDITSWKEQKSSLRITRNSMALPRVYPAIPKEVWYHFQDFPGSDIMPLLLACDPMSPLLVFCWLPGFA